MILPNFIFYSKVSFIWDMIGVSYKRILIKILKILILIYLFFCSQLHKKLSFSFFPIFSFIVSFLLFFIYFDYHQFIIHNINSLSPLQFYYTLRQNKQMTNIHKQIYSTPIKQKPSQFSPSSPSQTLAETDRLTQKKPHYAVDYKAKTYELMNENVELKAKQIQYKSRIVEIQQQLSEKQREVGQFLKKMSCRSFQEVINNHFSNRRLRNQAEYGNMQKNMKEMMNEYKNLAISTKLTNFTKQYQSLEISKKIEQLHKKYETSNKQLQEQNKQLKLQLKQVKQYDTLLLEEMDRISSHNQKLKQDLKISIQRYEEIDRIIQDKIKGYLDKIKEYEDFISTGKYLYQSENSSKQFHSGEQVFFDLNKGEMSFGNNSQPDSLPKFKEPSQNEQKQQQKDYEVDCECYKASIEGLLQQNKRLKKSFQNLYKLRQGQEIPEDLIKQINIMKSIIQLNENIDNID